MPQLTVVTYNIWGYHTPAEYLKRRGEARGGLPNTPAASMGPPESVWAKRRSLLVNVLEEADPDIIALQENVRRPDHPERSHAQQLGRALGMAVVEGSFHHMTDQLGRPYEMGVALLSHLPIDESSEADLPYGHPADIGGRNRLLQATLDYEGQPLEFWVTHFPYKSDEAQMDCAKAILRMAGDVPHDRPLLLCGDLNAEPDSPTMKRLMEGTGAAYFISSWSRLHPDSAPPTTPFPDPEQHFDYILFRDPSVGLTPVTAELIGIEPSENGLFPSDHCGLCVSFEMK